MTATRNRPVTVKDAPRPLLRALPTPQPDVVERAKKRWRPGLIAVAACSAIGVGLFANVAFTAITARTQFRLERVEHQANEAEAQYHRRRLEVATLESPQRIVDEARRLGMVQPDKVTYLAPTSETTATDAAVPEAPVTGGSPSWNEVKPHLRGGG